jgi:hypothetical protein
MGLFPAQAGVSVLDELAAASSPTVVAEMHEAFRYQTRNHYKNFI